MLTLKQLNRHLPLLQTSLLIALLMPGVSAQVQSNDKPDDLVDLEKLIPGIVLDIRYATTNNFMKRAVYPAAKCYLRRAPAEKIARVQSDLKEMGLALKIFDGYRPLSVQRKMWEVFPQEGYVANPAKGSRHNRGAAVDLTLVRADGTELPMPTDYDEFTEKAHRGYSDLPEDAIKNRELLEEVMVKHGFIGLPTEWWHFDDADWRNYELMDVEFDALEARQAPAKGAKTPGLSQ